MNDMMIFWAWCIDWVFRPLACLWVTWAIVKSLVMLVRVSTAYSRQIQDKENKRVWTRVSR